MSKNKKKIYFIDIAILIVVAIVLAITMPFAAEVEFALGLSYYVDANGERVDPSVASAEEAGKELHVHFVDVDQGDCCVIEFPNGEYAVIDGGENSKTKVEVKIDAFFEKYMPADFAYFDYCILTHPDSDHCGSLDYILNKYPAKVSYRPNVKATGEGYTDPGAADLTADATSKSTGVYRNVINAMYDPTAPHEFTPIVKVTDAHDDTQTITVGSGDDVCTLTFYTPLSTRYTGEGDWNNYSPIMILDYRGFSFVMSGDAEEKNLEEFSARVKAAPTDGVDDKYDRFTDTFNADVIKAGHHGSENATTSEYLEIMTSPDGVSSTYSVISCGAGNKYDHPHQAALDRITGVGIKTENILRTDEKGNIDFSVKPDTDGTFKLFYGDAATEKPVTPETDEPCVMPEYTLVHVKIGGVELRWTWLAWVCYAVIAIAVLIHIVYVKSRSSGDRKK